MILLNGWLIENISVYNKRWELQICPYAPLLMDISLSLSLSLFCVTLKAVFGIDNSTRIDSIP
jgi:hypothetical protein